MDLYDYRAAECACVELAAMKGMNLALLERLEALAHTEYGVNDRESYENFISKDTDFHLGIAQLARNHLLLQAVEAARISGDVRQTQSPNLAAARAFAFVVSSSRFFGGAIVSRE